MASEVYLGRRPTRERGPRHVVPLFDLDDGSWYNSPSLAVSVPTPSSSPDPTVLSHLLHSRRVLNLCIY